MFEDEERRQAVNCDHNDAHLVLDIRVSLLSTLPPIHTKVKQQPYIHAYCKEGATPPEKAHREHRF